MSGCHPIAEAGALESDWIIEGRVADLVLGNVVWLKKPGTIGMTWKHVSPLLVPPLTLQSALGLHQ